MGSVGSELATSELTCCHERMAGEALSGIIRSGGVNRAGGLASGVSGPFCAAFRASFSALILTLS